MRKKEYLFILFIAGIGLFMRLFKLAANPLWFDEASNITNALKGFNLISQPPYNYKPLYLILQRLWIEIFGVSAFMNRLLPALFGIASIFLVFRIAKNLFNVEIGLISSFLLSISVLHIFHSQQIGPETYIMFLTLLSFDTLVNFLIRRKTGFLVFNLALNILIVYTYPIGFLAFLSQWFYIILNHRLFEKSDIKKLLVSQCILLLSSLLLFRIIFLEREHYESVLWWANPPFIEHLFETFRTFSYGGPRYGLEDVSIRTSPLIVADLLTLIYSVLFVKGLFRIYRHKDRYNNRGAGNLIITWLFLPLILAILFSHIFFPVYFIRKLLFCLSPFYLVVSIGVYSTKRLSSVAVSSGIFLLSLIPLVIMYNDSFTVDWRQAVEFIRGEGIKEDAVIVIATCKELVPFMYYFADSDKKVLEEVGMFGKFEDGKWQESFRYKKNRIITIASERHKLKNKDIIPGRSPDHNRYKCDYIISEFDKKVFRKDVLDEGRQVWVLLSRWTGIDEKCIQSIVDRFKECLKLRLEEKRGEVNIFCFEA